MNFHIFSYVTESHNGNAIHLLMRTKVHFVVDVLSIICYSILLHLSINPYTAASISDMIEIDRDSLIMILIVTQDIVYLNVYLLTCGSN